MNHAPSATRNAFSLVEVTLALGVAGFALVAIFGLLPIGLNSNQASFQQTAAANLATEILADLRLVPSAAAIARAAASTPSVTLSSKSPKYQVDAAVTGNTSIYLDDSGTPQTMAQARYKAAVSLTQPIAAQQRTATSGSIVISWPPAATNPSGTVAICVGLDRN